MALRKGEWPSVQPNYYGDWTIFTHAGESPSGKTLLFTVWADGGKWLGDVRWFARWRKYAFYPAADTVYESNCLCDIAQFCELKTREHKSREGK